MITNTHSVGVVRDAVVAWLISDAVSADIRFALPVVAETFDGILNDVNGFHVKKEHVFEALNGAASGPLAEGNVGGGTGMVCHRFKGGIGASSRKLDAREGGYTVGVLVQANYGDRKDLTIAGVPVGREITDFRPGVGAETGAANREFVAWFFLGDRFSGSPDIPAIDQAAGSFKTHPGSGCPQAGQRQTSAHRWERFRPPRGTRRNSGCPRDPGSAPPGWRK